MTTRWIAIGVVSFACSGGGPSKSPGDARPSAPPADARPAIDAAPPAEPSTTVEGQVKRGDMIVKILKRATISGEAGQELIQALKPVLDFKKLQPGQRYKIVHRRGRVLEFEIQLTETATIKVVRGADDKLVADVI